MQCPNCRKVEKGEWLYANGYGSVPEVSMDDVSLEDDLHELSYSELVKWQSYLLYSFLSCLMIKQFVDCRNFNTAILYMFLIIVHTKWIYY